MHFQLELIGNALCPEALVLSSRHVYSRAYHKELSKSICKAKARQVAFKQCWNGRAE